MPARYTVAVHPAHDVPEMPVMFRNVTEVTTIDANSHGTGPLGRLEDLGSGDARLIICSPNVTAVKVTRQ